MASLDHGITAITMCTVGMLEPFFGLHNAIIIIKKVVKDR
jgi:hypothetical protein